MSKFTDEVARICNQERATFNNGKAREWWDPQFKRIGVYWNKLSIVRDGRTDITFKKTGAKFDLDDVNKQRIPVKNDNPPWSAAFISFVAREAGAGSDFAYSGYHSLYIMKALRAAANPATTDKWIARRGDSLTPKVGDLIACGRERAKTATFDTAASFVATGKKVDPDLFPSHCDFVVEVKSDRIITIGGNVGNSVGLKNWLLDKNGHIGTHDPQSKTASVICVIECKL